MPRLQFWYELASTYSYLSAMRIEGMAAVSGVEIEWRPFLLGPIFKAQGWDTSPFNIYLAKGRYMRRDMARLCATRGLPLTMPDPFPARSLLATRLALLGERDGWTAPFSKAVLAEEFGRGADISDPALLERILGSVGADAKSAMAAAGEATVKEALKQRSAEAATLGLIGAPSFVTADGEVFWGDDRLSQAIEWARRG